MALGAREMLLVIRARDLASSAVRNVGAAFGTANTQAMTAGRNLTAASGALIAAGVGLTAVGGAALKFLDDATDAAIEYNRQAGLTLTQVDKLGVSVDDIGKIGLRVAKEIPKPLEEMQPALYDIFSTLDVSLPQAEYLLTQFSKAGVAGQVDLQAASRATMGILNAFNLQVEDTTRVNDVMFQLVRKGVGTYEEFATTVGMAVPAAARAGQSIEGLAGMLAFMTRNGVTASVAAQGAGRALENMTNPKVIDRMKAMGINVTDAAGNFRPMVDVVGDLSSKLQQLNPEERARALDALFKGAGNTVQARRFWNLAVNNFDEFKQRTDEMINSAGAMDNAYDIMFKQPQSQIELMKNKYKAMRIEIGQQLIPIKLKLLSILSKLLDWWNKLSPSTQKLIIQVVAITSALMVLSGILLTVIGTVGLMVGGLMMLGVGFGAALAIVGAFLAALLLIPVAVVLIIKYWDEIKDATSTAWKYVYDIIDGFVQAIIAFVMSYVKIIVSFWDHFGDELIESAKRTWQFVLDIVRLGIQYVKGVIDVVMGIITGDWSRAWDGLKNIISAAMTGFVEAIKFGFFIMKMIFIDLPKEMLSWLGDVGMILYEAGKKIIKGLWEGMKDMWKEVESWVGSVGGWIADKKGPLTYDARLLIPNGRTIMQGLMKGLQAEMPELERQLAGITNTLSGDMNVNGFNSPSGTPTPTVAQQGGMHFYGDVTFGKDDAVDEFDWWTRTKGAGV
jgi:TP901 family phage tail tape measure protein